MYELSVDANYLGKPVSNVYYYEQRSLIVPIGVTISQVLADRFDAEKLNSILAPLLSNFAARNIRVRNLFNDSDAYEKLISKSGSQTPIASNQSMPTFISFSYDLVGTNPAVKQGRKNFCGVGEGQQDGGIMTNAGLIPFLISAGAAMSSPVTNGSAIPVNTFFPVTVKRVRSGVSGEYEYRLPAFSGETVLSSITFALYRAAISSLVSRKF